MVNFKIPKSLLAILNKIKFFLIVFLIVSSFLFIAITITSCDETFLDIYTDLKTNYSGTRSIDLAIKTEYLQKGELIFKESTPLYDKILTSLPPGKIETYEKDKYTHFKSTQEFDDINFLKHFSIDNFSEPAPERFYAKMKVDNYFFYSNYFFYDFVDLEIDETIIESEGKDGIFSKVDSFFKADKELFKITYQIKFPVKITKSNADIIGSNNIAIWNITYGDKKDIYIEGKKTKFLTYFLVVILGFAGLFIIFLIFAIVYSRKRRRIGGNKKPYYTYENYFKKDRYFN